MEREEREEVGESVRGMEGEERGERVREGVRGGGREGRRENANFPP